MYVFHMSFGLIVLDSCDGVLTYATIHNNCEFAAAGMDSERAGVLSIVCLLFQNLLRRRCRIRFLIFSLFIALWRIITQV